MSNFQFTVIAVANRDDGFEKTVESILKSTNNLKATQLIIADCVNSDMTKSAAQKAVSANSEHTRVLTLEGHSEAQAFNKTLPLIKGNFVVFAEEGVTYTKKEFSSAAYAFRKYPNVTLTMTAVSLAKDESKKLYQNYPLEAKGVIDLNENPYFGQAALSTYFFRAQDLNGLEFDENIFDECKKKFILEALLNNPRVFVLKNCSCFYSHSLENDSNLFSQQYNKWYYSPSIQNFMIPFMKNLKGKYSEVPKFVQFTLSQLICAKYANNYYENDKGILTNEEAHIFYNDTCEALGYIDNDIFTEAAISCKYTLRSLWFQLLKGKHQAMNLPYEIGLDNELIYLKSKGNANARITTLQSVALTVNVINYNNGMLEFDAEFTGKDFMETEDIKLYAEYGNERHLLEEYPVYPLLKCFGVPYAKKYSVHFFVPSENLESLKFGYMLCGKYHTLPIHFANQFSRLRLRFGKAYWKFNSKQALAIKNGNTLYTFKCTGIRHLVRELNLFVSMFLHTKNKFFAIQCIGLRTIFRLTRPFFKGKRIFLTFDKLYKAGDNGEYFWKYANSVKDDIETYYIVSDTSLDYPRLKKYDDKHTVVHNSLKCRLLALNMEAIAATHTLVMQYCGFPKYLHPYFLDLWNVKVICIQHGLTVQQLAQYQRRTYDNTTLYCLASKYEKKNLMHPVYGYEENMLKLNGLARYDGLKNNDKKEILITPTWRRNVVSQGIAYKKKPYNELFKHTEYFRLYNTLINDEKLIECAKKNGYSITYLLHPAMSPQLEDFKCDGFVKVIAASGDMNYEKILTESSLMVTDYSGVQFDFAYMRKPIVYYHPDTLPPHYEAGGIHYPTQGFGPICTDHNTLVDTVCRFMDNGCKAETEYKLRADDFFEFDDFRNCERIYNEILNSLQ